MQSKAVLRVGTSGWNYGGWRGIFYPEDLKSAHYLEWYSRHFDTTEVNYSYAYFNNDFRGYAIDNARTLLRLATGRRQSGRNT